MSDQSTAFRYLLAFEFTRYGACYQILNQISSDGIFEVFEVSPTPQGGILILLAKEKIISETFYSSIMTQFKNTMTDAVLIEDIRLEVLQTYLSQNKPEIKNSLYFYELDGVCKSLKKAQDILSHGGELIDFRVLRSTNHRCIIITDKAVEPSEEALSLKNPNELVRSYFSI